MLSGRGRNSSGVTLVELLAAMALTGLLAAAILRVTVSEQRFLHDIESMIETRRAVRAGVGIPRHDLRAVAPESGGIYQMAAGMIEFRLALGSSVICRLDSARRRVGIPSRTAWSGLTSWVTAPRRGDTVLVFDGTWDSTLAPWEVHVLADDPSAGGICPVSTGFAGSAAEAGGEIGRAHV